MKKTCLWYMHQLRKTSEVQKAANKANTVSQTIFNPKRIFRIYAPFWRSFCSAPPLFTEPLNIVLYHISLGRDVM